MASNLELVRRFHQALGIPVQDAPGPVTVDRENLRISLLLEEAQEAQAAMMRGDLAEIAQELADVLVVTYGAALEYGIPLDAVMREVMAANMRKAGGPVRADGKVLKPAGWQPPDVAGLLGVNR